MITVQSQSVLSLQENLQEAQENLILITKSVINGMKKNKWGRIVNISSIWGTNPCKKRSIYSLTKSALVSLFVLLFLAMLGWNVYFFGWLTIILFSK